MKTSEALTLDYQSTCAFIDKCDDHIFKVKGWALVTSSAVIAYSISSGSYVVVFSNLLLVPAFLYMELIYKSFQDSAIEHTTELSERIDRSLRTTTTEPIAGYSFGFGRKLQYPSAGQCLKILVNPQRRHILNFYGLMLVFSFGAFLIGFAGVGDLELSVPDDQEVSFLS